MIDEITAFENYVQDTTAQENAARNPRSESAVRAELMAHFTSRGWPWIGLHGDAYLIGWPDFLAIMPGGRAILVEAKKEGKHSRKLQAAIQRRIRRAGAIVVSDATCWADVEAALIAASQEGL